jgi:hypothetical protein
VTFGFIRGFLRTLAALLDCGYKDYKNCNAPPPKCISLCFSTERHPLFTFEERKFTSAWQTINAPFISASS